MAVGRHKPGQRAAYDNGGSALMVGLLDRIQVHSLGV